MCRSRNVSVLRLVLLSQLAVIGDAVGVAVVAIVVVAAAVVAAVLVHACVRALPYMPAFALH